MSYDVKRNWKYDPKTGMDKPDGWNLFCGDAWCQWFWLKRDAVAARDELMAQADDTPND